MDWLNSPWFVMGVSAVVLAVVVVAKKYGINLPISVGPSGSPAPDAVLEILKSILASQQAQNARQSEFMYQQLSPAQPVQAFQDAAIPQGKTQMAVILEITAVQQQQQPAQYFAKEKAK